MEGEEAHGGASGRDGRRSARPFLSGGADLILTSMCEWQERERKPGNRRETSALEVEALRLRGKTCAEAVRSIGVSEVTYRRWRAEFGGLIFDLAITERETHIEPNGVPDDRRGELVAGKRDRHPPSYPPTRYALPLP